MRIPSSGPDQKLLVDEVPFQMLSPGIEPACILPLPWSGYRREQREGECLGLSPIGLWC